MEEFTNFNRLLELLHAQPVLTLFLILGPAMIAHSTSAPGGYFSHGYPSLASR